MFKFNNNSISGEILSDEQQMALRTGLQSLPVPAVSANFDEIVLNEIGQALTWRDVFIQSLRPVFSGVFCSLFFGFLAIHFLTTGSVNISLPVNTSPTASIKEIDLDNPNIYRLSFRPMLIHMPIRSSTQSPPTAEQPPEHPKRSSDEINRATRLV